MEETTTPTKVWNMTLEEDKNEVIAYFIAAPAFRIVEHMERFWVEWKYPTEKATYTSLEDVIAYELIHSNYFTQNGFKCIEDAEEAYLQFRAKPIIHKVPELPTETPATI